MKQSILLFFMSLVIIASCYSQQSSNGNIKAKRVTTNAIKVKKKANKIPSNDELQIIIVNALQKFSGNKFNNSFTISNVVIEDPVKHILKVYGVGRSWNDVAQYELGFIDHVKVFLGHDNKWLAEIVEKKDSIK